MTRGYVHGYDLREAIRLQDQAGVLADLLHHDTAYPGGSRVLEAGCGVGAQTVTLARNSPDARIVSIDISTESLKAARAAVDKAGIANVEFLQADIFSLPFEPESFDHVFVCFVLEHLPQPAEALRALKRTLKPGGALTAIEGDHGSTFFYPDCNKARTAIRCLVDLQRAAGGNANIGRELYPLLTGAGFEAVRVSPRMVYVDGSNPQLVEGFTKKTFTAMIEGVRKPVVEAGLMGAADFDTGVRSLRRAAGADGVFCYTFFKGAGLKPGPSGDVSQGDRP
ncbi:MAG: methyltransferase domain-containing protein [Actinobacteria bacterium]|nr:methyltransferase domain-containing protein [Actinomycetota bacterium]